MFAQQPILEEILVEQKIVSKGLRDAQHRLFICGEVVPSVSNASAVCDRRLVPLRARRLQSGKASVPTQVCMGNPTKISPILY